MNDNLKMTRMKSLLHTLADLVGIVGDELVWRGERLQDLAARMYRRAR